MAVGIQLDFEGGTIAQYDAVCERMGLKPQGPGPKGILFHWVQQTENGFRVIDVWGAREDFEKFAAEQIGPFSEEAGLAQPAIQFFDAYNYFTSNT